MKTALLLALLALPAAFVPVAEATHPCPMPIPDDPKLAALVHFVANTCGRAEHATSTACDRVLGPGCPLA